jgi:hypothetical protein
MADEDLERDGEGAYIPATQAVKLIPRPFEGNPKQLREFIEGAEAAIEVTHPRQRELVLKFIVAKIQGDAKDKLLARVERDTWPQIKGILEENYLVRRTLEYYTGALFNSRQSPAETVAQWGARLDTLAMDLRREVRQRLQIMEEREHGHYVEGGLKLIGEFLKGIFIAGLKDERVKMIVKTRGEEGSIAQLIETAIQEECELKSQRFKSNLGSTTPWYQRNVQQGKQGFQMPPIKREVNVTTMTKCFRCGKLGHLIKNCRNSPQRSECGRRGHSEQHCHRQGNGRQEVLGSRDLPAAKRTAE